MKVGAIKKLVETYQLPELQKAEEDILEEKTPEISIEGEDDGEQLTHVSAAVCIIKDMQENGVDDRTALRNYMQRVRNSIS